MQQHEVLLDMSDSNINLNNRVIRAAQVCELTNVSRSTVWRWGKNDKNFPNSFKLSNGVTVWSEAEIAHWLDAKKTQCSSGISNSVAEGAS